MMAFEALTDVDQIAHSNTGQVAVLQLDKLVALTETELTAFNKEDV